MEQETNSTLPPTAPAQENRDPQAVAPVLLQPGQTNSDQFLSPAGTQTLQVVGAPAPVAAAPAQSHSAILTTVLIVITFVLLAAGLRLLNISNHTD